MKRKNKILSDDVINASDVDNLWDSSTVKIKLFQLELNTNNPKHMHCKLIISSTLLAV